MIHDDYDATVEWCLMNSIEPADHIAALTQRSCEECGHPISAHGKYGCEIERGDRWVDGESMGGWMAMGPCGCQATTLEPADEAVTLDNCPHTDEVRWEPSYGRFVCLKCKEKIDIPELFNRDQDVAIKIS